MELFRVAGIRVGIHPAVSLLFVACIALGLVVQAILLFALVIGHELVHLLVARAYGFQVKGLELFPFGGAAYCDDLFEGRKVEESVMALAGPMFNVFLLLGAQVLRWQGWWTGSLAEDFVRYNFWLAAFNLLPVLPLDGGRIVRALLVGSFGFVRTTKALAWGGRWLGIGLVLAGLVLWGAGRFADGTVFLILLGVFFWLAGGKEIVAARVTFLRQLMHKKEELARKGLMRNKGITVYQATPLIRIVEDLIPDRYALVSVTGDAFTVTKILTETEILEGMLREGIHYPVGKL